ncbi:MAG: putative ABC transporter permease [Faecalibacterium sp.]|jgi:uncharacterized membrane protein|nr:putative ABC transporter permease [Faecalibacterium sp.]
MIAGYTFYQIAWYFAIYSFIGWCVEVVYCTVTSGKVVNRGFLNGPVCPIYGFGMLAVLVLLKSWDTGMGHASIPLLFFGGMILATTVELIGGWLMWKLFHARWWDYSKKPFNIGGFVCLEFSLIWGLGAVGVVKLLQPLVARAADTGIPPVYGWPILAVLYAIYFVDFVVTLCTVAGLNRDLRELDAVRSKLRIVSDALSDGLGTGALETDRRLDEGKLQATLAKAEARDALVGAASSAADALADVKSTAFGTLTQAKAQAAETLAGARTDVVQAVAEAKQSAAAAKAERAAVQQANRLALEKRAEALRQDILQKQYMGGGRLLKAFPQMEHTDHRELLDELKLYYSHKN